MQSVIVVKLYIPTFNFNSKRTSVHDFPTLIQPVEMDPLLKIPRQINTSLDVDNYSHFLDFNNCLLTSHFSGAWMTETLSKTFRNSLKRELSILGKFINYKSLIWWSHLKYGKKNSSSFKFQLSLDLFEI